ncbi:acyltransferase family protein [Desulfoluna limicola]|uniref:acyltransferase family protein n=1 Tax=Desulfoluna limicola TaxID=2810562 RepID=UPI0021067C91|nr:acyltransferase family protein [Desulfoluna limicola]
MLSGFFVCGKAMKNLCDRTFIPIEFAIDRFARIMIPLLPALILTVCIAFITNENISGYHFVGNLFSLQNILVPVIANNEPLWSLGYEVWFYVFCGAIGTLVMVIRSRLNYFISFCFALVIIFLFYFVFTKLKVVYLFCWVIGGLAYIFRTKKFSWRWFFISLVIVTYGTIGIELSRTSKSIVVDNLSIYMPSLINSILIFSIGIALFIQQTRFLQPQGRVMFQVEALGTKFAAVSYTLYLTHAPILHLMKVCGIDRAPLISLYSISIYFAVVSICIMCAWLIYWPFERRTSEVKKWIKCWLATSLSSSRS